MDFYAIKSYFEKNNSDLIKWFLEKNLHKNAMPSVVTQNIKMPVLFVLELQIDYKFRWRFFKFQKKLKSLHSKLYMQLVTELFDLLPPEFSPSACKRLLSMKKFFSWNNLQPSRFYIVHVFSPKCN